MQIYLDVLCKKKLPKYIMEWMATSHISHIRYEYLYIFIYYFALHHISMGVIDDGNDEDDGAHD